MIRTSRGRTREREKHCVVDREGPQLTGGVRFFAGVTHAQVAFGRFRISGYSTTEAVVLPLGALAAWMVVWRCSWPAMLERGLGSLQ